MVKRRKKGKKFILLMSLFFVLSSLFLLQTPKEKLVQDEVFSRRVFFQELGPLAQEVGDRYGLFPSVILAQAALESNYGQSRLTKQHKNYFGIKGNKESGVCLPTVEIEKGNRVEVEDYFRTYESVEESFEDYGRLIGKKDRYKPVREAQTKEDYAKRLYQTGYSTNPDYGRLVLELIDQYKLDSYDP